MTIKNCPFCGAGAEVVRQARQKDGRRFTAVAVRCIVCWAKSREAFVSVVDDMAERDAEEEAVRAWNRRNDENQR